MHGNGDDIKMTKIPNDAQVGVLKLPSHDTYYFLSL